MGGARQNIVLLFMFIRKKKNRSGTTSIVVVSKRNGLYKEIKTIGVSDDIIQIDFLYKEGKKWVDNHCGIRDIFNETTQEYDEKQVVEYSDEIDPLFRSKLTPRYRREKLSPISVKEHIKNGAKLHYFFI